MVRWIHILFSVLFITNSYGQDSAGALIKEFRDVRDIQKVDYMPIELKTVSISRSNFSNIKSNQNLQSIANIYQKNYGDGQLSTIQFRGFSAQHNDVEWRGIPLNSPFNGTVDLSTIPFPLGRSHSSLRNLGNAISINTSERELPENKGSHELSANLRLYNFYNFKYHFAKETNNNLLQIDTDIKKGANNFRYTDNGVSKNMAHNDFEQYSFFLNHLKSIFNKNKSRSFSVWYTHTNRNIPPVMTSAHSAQIMKDNTLRLSMMHQNRTLNNHFLIELNQSNYSDPNTQVFGTYSNQSFKNKISIVKNFRHFELSMYTLASLDFLQTNNYQSNQILFNHLINIGLEKRIKKHLLRLSFTTIEQNEKFRFLLPTLYHQYDLHHHRFVFNIRTTADIKSRFANANDLFWNGAGNPLLKPEYSYQAENKIQLDTRIKKNELSVQCRSFLYFTQDLIYWTPNSNGLWTPQNLNQVLSYGFNPTLLFKLFKTITIENSYQYNPALVLDEIHPDIHQKQILYSPLHKWSNNAVVQFKKWQLELGHIFTSERYYTTDNSQSLSPYHLMNAAIYYKIPHIEFGLKCNNLLNISYQEIVNRAMPGILPSIQIKYTRL